MRKIIDGKRYDTETATEVGEETGGQRGNFSFWSEKLYRTPRGNYFLHCKGGAGSKYCERVDVSTWGPGEQIRPLSFNAAKAWGEHALDANDWEAEFGEAQDAEGVASIAVSASTRNRLRRMASERGCSIGEMVTQLMG